MNSGLTQRTADCLAAIRKLTKGGVSPSLEELRVDLDLSSRGRVHHLLKLLKERGLVAWEPNHPRSIRILDDQFGADDLGRMSTDALERVWSMAYAILVERGRL